MFYGQFVINKNGYWQGRKNVPANWLDMRTLKNKIQKAVVEKMQAVHISLFLRNDKTHPTELTGDFILDFDGSFENLDAVKKEITPLVSDLVQHNVPFVLAYSGHRGFKIAIPQKAFGIPNSLELPAIYKTIAEKLKKQYNLKTVDTGIYNAMHTNRLTNTIHEKTGLFQTPITPETFFSLTASEIKEYARTQHFLPVVKVKENPFLKTLIPENIPKQKKTVRPAKIQGIPPCIQAMVETGAKEGERNNTAIRIASFLYMAGKTKEEVESILFKWNNNNNPPMSEKEIVYIASYIEKKQYRFSCYDQILSKYCPFARKSQCSYFRNKTRVAA